jgi:hypothetical protein
MDFSIIVDYFLALDRDLLQTPHMTKSKEPLVVRRCGHLPDSTFLKDWTVIFDNLATAHRKLIEMTIGFQITRENVFIVNGDRDWFDFPMNLAVILDEFLYSDVYLSLTPLIIRYKQILLVAGLHDWHNYTSHNATKVFGHFILTDWPLQQYTLTTNEQVISLVTFFDDLEKVLAWADFNKFRIIQIFFN